MNFSGNMPKHPNGKKQPINVNPEADAEFLNDLKRQDLSRYNRLVGNMQKVHYAGQETPKKK